MAAESDLTQTFIQKYYDELCKSLDVAAIAGKLFAKNIIDFVRKQEIISKGSTQEANATFADYLYRHANKDTLKTFLQILEKDPQYPKHKDLGAAMRKDWTELLSTSESEGRSTPESCEPPSDQSTNGLAQQQPPKETNDGTGHKVTASPAAGPKPPKTEHFGPTSSEQTGDVEEDKKQDDTPHVEVSVDASKNSDYNFPQDEPVPEDLPEVEVEEAFTTRSMPPMKTGSKLKSKRRTPTTVSPSQLAVVCFPCLHEMANWKHIKPTGQCTNPSHEKVYQVKRGERHYPVRERAANSRLEKLCTKGYFDCKLRGICIYAHWPEEQMYWKDPSRLPTLELCKHCRWERCLKLCQMRCFVGAHLEPTPMAKINVVVCKAEDKLTLVEVRCPRNYLNMRDQKYIFTHTQYRCNHHPYYTCGFPHSDIEEEIWNVWKGTASANVTHRNARTFLTEIVRALKEDTEDEQHTAAAPAQGAVDQKTRLARITSSPEFTPEAKAHPPRVQEVEGKLLAADYTPAIYKEKFRLLINLEEKEHEEALKRCDGTFGFQQYLPNAYYDHWQGQHQWYGSLEVPQYLGDHVRQAATHVELEQKSGKKKWELTADIIPFQKFLNGKHYLLLGFETPDKPQELPPPHKQSSLNVQVRFLLKHRYFVNLRSAISVLPVDVLPKLVPDKESVKGAGGATECEAIMKYLPRGFQLDEEYQGPTCRQLLRSSPNVPFLITGPFGTGKTRLIAAAAYCILKTSPQSRILIATHHHRTADEYVETYFTERLVVREGLSVVRLVGNDTPHYKLHGLVQTSSALRYPDRYQLIIATFIVSMGLSRRLREGHFTHIFIDEGAQAREPETVAAFSRAGHRTKIAIAGDHKQVGPKTSVLGKVPREKGLADSLLVRLHNLYSKLPGAAAHQAKLLINYRCHPAIVRLPSRLFYDCRIQTAAEVVPHPKWDKMVYFVCSSLELNDPVASSKGTQEELLHEAQLEVQELKQLVQGYIRKQSRSGTSLGKNTVCVMFPTRLTETLWKGEVHHLHELKQVTCAVAYDIQGREFDAIFVCTAQPVNQDYSPFDPVKSMCDPFMFNTIVTRPKSLLVVIGNPFRLRKIEQNTPTPPACWSEYLYQCWEGGTLFLSAQLKQDLGACKKQLGELQGIMFQRAAEKLRRVAPKAVGKEEGKGGKKDSIMLDYSGDSRDAAVQGNGWKLGEKKRVMIVPDEQISGLCLECKLDGYSAIPTKPGLKPIFIPGIDERRCAFDRATVMVEETKQLVAGRRTGKVVSVEQQGPVEPMICTVDPHNPLILVPVGGKNPKMVNLPNRDRGDENDPPKPLKKTAVEAVVTCYSPECLTGSVDAIPFKAATDMFFIAQPLQWSVQERYPIGAVIGCLPKCPPPQLSEKILSVQHKVPQSTNFSRGTTSSNDVTPVLPLSAKPQFETAIGIRDRTGICNMAFSVERKKNHFTVAVHVSNVVDLVSGTEEFKKRKFNAWYSLDSVLPPDVLHACDFSKTPIQKAITVEFKVEDPMSIFSVATRKNMLVARPSVKLVSIQRTVVQCCSMLAKSDVEYILLSLQTGPAADGKLAQGMTMSVHDALTILYCTAEHQHKARHGHGGYPLLEMTSYEHPETEKMVNELLTMANSEVAEMIAKAHPDRALLVTQGLPNYSHEVVQDFSEDLALLPEPAIYPWLAPQGQAASRHGQCLTVSAQLLKALIAALKRVDFLQARQLLHFLHYHPQFVALQEAITSAMNPETFTVGCSHSADKSPTNCVRRVLYTSCTDPLRCIGDVYVQEQLLAAVGGHAQQPPRSVREEKDIATHCNRSRVNAKAYESAKSRLNWAHFAQQSSLHVQSVVRSVEGGVLQLCCQYDRQGNVQETIALPVPTLCRHMHSDYTAKVTNVASLLQVPAETQLEYHRESGSKSIHVYGAGGLLKGHVTTAPPAHTVQVPTDVIDTVMNCINAFDEETVPRALKSLTQLEKQENSSPSRRPSKPEYQDAHFLLLEFPLPLSPHQLVDVWMRMDTTQFIPTPKPQLVEIGHSDVRVCLHHTEQPEACFTAGSTVQAPQQVQSSIESYVSEWVEVLLAEAAWRSVERRRHMLINDVLIRFNKFVELAMFASEQFYQPVGEVTMVLPRAFVEDRQDIFPLEQGDLMCARYEVNLLEEEAGLELLERHGNCFPPHHEPVGRLVLHLVVERVVVKGTQQEVMISQEMLQTGVEVYLRVVGEQGARLSPLMRDLLVANKHTCQVEVVPMEPQLRSVYQSLRRLPHPTATTKLAVDIMLGDVKAFITARVLEHPTFDELTEECPSVGQMHESLPPLNAGQQAALERAYQSKFHIIQGPPGTKKLVVAVHLAYTFAQKNRRLGVRKATGLQHCVLLCAPDDTAVDTTLSLLQIVAGSSDKNIRVLRIYSREVERKHCPGPYQDTNVFEETATADYSIPQSVEKFALHKLTSSKLTLPAELEEKVQYSNMEVPQPDQRSEYRRLVAEAERQVIQEGQFDVVLCTCSEAGSARIQRYFTPFQCIVYEASLATEPETVAAIARSSHQVVLIGDHSSVCPPVCSQVAGLAGLGVSLFEKYAHQLMEEDEYGLYSFLEEQYRMVDPLCEFPSREFYNGQLKPSPMLKNYSYPRLAHFWPKGNGLPLVLCNVKGTEERDGSKSAEDTIVNRREAEKVVDVVQKMVTALSGGKAKYVKETLAVLTTTEAQKSLIQSLLRETDMDKNTMEAVRSQVMTIRASRGTKVNLVVLSTVRSCSTGAHPNDWTALLDHQWAEEHLGLLCRSHHTCRALTTGKHGLVIVGDRDLLCHNDTWRHLVEHCKEGKGCLVESDTFPSEHFIQSLQQS